MVMERGSGVAYAAGYLVFMRDGNLLAQRFNADKLEFLGDPFAIAQDVDYWNPRDLGNFSVAGASALVYRTATIVQSQLGWAQPGSSVVQAFGEQGRFSVVRVSPDGRAAAVTRVEPGGMGDVWLLDLARENLSRLTFDSSIQNFYAFSPDGKRIAIAQNGAVGRRIILRSATGAPGVETVYESGDWTLIWDWTPDGRYLVLGLQRAETGTDIFYLDLEGGGAPVPLIVALQDQGGARVSPNGKWMAYQSSESGRFEVYVTDFPAASRKFQVTSGGGNSPFWSTDGRQLLFNAGGQLKSVEVRDPERMDLGALRDIAMPSDILDGAFLPGEKRALVLRRGADGPPPPVQLILNWTQVLE